MNNATTLRQLNFNILFLTIPSNIQITEVENHKAYFTFQIHMISLNTLELARANNTTTLVSLYETNANKVDANSHAGR